MPGERISIANAPQAVHAPHVAPAPRVDHVARQDAVAQAAPDQAAANGFSAQEGGFCTSAQIRRFIKSRPYVPMHELRRRFELNGGADDVSVIPTPGGLVYLGLPARESQFIADLVRHGDVGLELCHDPRVPMVMGVFAIRPITRQ
ncbi:MAG: hypothetical protein H0T04_04800 [Chloroflexi bacterium]|nr:hypothetical protein [Chloroflexota bacterium]MDQ3408134.1 hypothetical protein [Chloroflexota bacterium]